MQVRTFAKWMVLVPAVALAAACSRDNANARPDDALQNDLSLASQAQAYRQQQFVSPQELMAQQYPYGQPGMYPNGYAPMPVQAGYANGPYYAVAPQPQPVRERVVYRTRSSGSSSRGSSGGGVIYREPATRVKKNTKRDAAIGAVAGAAIGVATSSRADRVKGGLLGAVIGAAAGAVVGNNVDKSRVPY